MIDDEKDYSEFLAGDNAGFERLVIRYKDGLIYYLNKIIKNITMAEDLAQDAFVEVYVHKERFVPGKASFKTYLYTIGHHKAVDYVRKVQREVLTDFHEEEETAMSGFDSPEVHMLEKEGKEELYQALDRLKEEYQKVLVLTELEGMKLKDAAKIMGKTETQIKVLAHRARKALLLQLQNKM
ncbi:MAG: RNA polymerase sigma factor [Lachnospiraceae bacterium]|nr:RNA polymerase sigma factor [Lachnospiraceae bacterium]